MNDRTLEALRRRLEKWELQHLRALSAELHERLDRAEDEASRAWESCEFWQRNATDMQLELMEADYTVGLTKDGQIVAAKNGDPAPSQGDQTTFILCGPQAIGKTHHAERIAAALGCSQIIDDWNGTAPLPPGALAITNVDFVIPPGGIALHVEDRAGIDALVGAFAPNDDSRKTLIELLNPWVQHQKNEFSTADAAKNGLMLDESKLTRDLQTRIGTALRKIGCEKIAIRDDDSHRYMYRFQRSEMVEESNASKQFEEFRPLYEKKTVNAVSESRFSAHGKTQQTFLSSLPSEDLALTKALLSSETSSLASHQQPLAREHITPPGEDSASSDLHYIEPQGL